ncbi:hypothetical protein AVTE2539_01500 [Acidovorax sp. SUPP2539]|nr:hypothetical protein AVTE2539_01500 [Acidovorax sp. SUPP2539]
MGARQGPAATPHCENYIQSQALTDAPPTNPPELLVQEEMDMLHYAVVFLVIALIAALFGFGGIAAGAVGIAKILFFVFVIMAVVTFVLSLLKRG